MAEPREKDRNRTIELMDLRNWAEVAAELARGGESCGESSWLAMKRELMTNHRGQGIGRGIGGLLDCLQT